MKESILKRKSYDFAIKIVFTYKQICTNTKEFTLSRQLLRSGTSIGANIREAEYAQSNKDFIHKMSIALKESNETEYWLNILHDTGFLNAETHNELIAANTELLKMLTSTINTMKAKN